MTFQHLFGRPPTVSAEAPGRVNLIGEHTDYNGGFVLPVPIPRRTRVQLAPRDGHRVRAASASVGPIEVLEYDLGAERPGRGWLDYVQGVTHALRAEGYAVQGFDLWVESDLPLGSGLASSAALEVSLLRALRTAFSLELDDVPLALLGQRAENEFVGARVGIMDQVVASLGEEGSALLIDTHSLVRLRRISLPPALELVVLDSGVKHAHAGGEYNARRAECERAAELLGVEWLRDVDVADLPRIEALPPPLDRRARHVVTENARVLEAVEALRGGELPRLGRLLDASHASLRDDYEVSVPELDLLAELARREPEVHGARLTGGGFGGAVLALARASTGHEVGERVVAEYVARSGRPGRLLIP